MGEEHVMEEKSDIEKEFEHINASRKRRREVEAESDDEEAPEGTDTPHEAPEARNTLEALTQAVEKKHNVPTKKVQKIDLNAVLNKDVGGVSNAEIVETEDADGTTTTIQEAFADDDVISEFKTAKRSKVEEEKGKVVDLILPGWDGKWAGEDFKPSKRQKRRFRIKQKTAPRQDRHLGHVIISEKNSAVQKMRVEHLPFPFQNPAQFEKSISQPLGQTWNTAGGFREMNAAPVMTTPGQIIQPARMEKEKRHSDIFTVELSDNNAENAKKQKGNIPKKKKGGRRKTAADDLSLSSM